MLACLPALQELLNKKDMVGDCFNQLRLARQRTLNDKAVVSELLPAVRTMGRIAEN